MHKKQLIRFAEYLRDTNGYCEPFTAKQIEHLANFCREQNPAFKRDRWIGFISGDNGPNGGTIRKN